MWIAATIVLMQAAAGAPEATEVRPAPAAVAKAVERAQQRFERIRRISLPVTDRQRPPECDATIGMYCYWYDATDVLPTPREHQRVAAARSELLSTLDSLAPLAPEDSLLLALRVMYRIDAADTAGAVRVAATDCAAAAWWCAAVLGYARHVAGDFSGAAVAFDSATAAMDSTQRCAWADVAPLLPSRARGRVRRLPCETRAQAAERVWWLADPLLSDGANDFRTEMLARRTAALVGDRGIATYDLRWNRDAEEMLLRYGWPIWWSRERPPQLSTMANRVIVGHERVPSFAFPPRDRLLADTAAIPETEDWRAGERLPITRYAPAWARSWREIPAQLARFRRGDSLLVVAAFAVAHDTLMRAPSARLAVSAAPGAPSFVSPAVSAHEGALTLTLPSIPPARIALAGVEIMDTTTHAVARHRTGLQPLADGELVVSDVLLHAAGASGAADGEATLDDVLAHALPSNTIRRGKVGIYWEAYCQALREPFTVALALERTDRSWVSRAASRVGLADASSTIHIQWTDTPRPGRQCAARSMTLDTSDLGEGSYDLRIEVRTERGAAATAMRRVTLTR